MTLNILKTINITMTENESNKQIDSRYSVKSPGRGGVRPGAGRPKGSSNKISIEDLIDSIETRSGMSYTDQIASNYVSAIQREDWSRVENYDRALLNKIVADKSEVLVESNDDIMDTKRTAFLAAMNQIIGINKDNKDDDASN